MHVVVCLIRLSKIFYYLVTDKHLHGLMTGLVSPIQNNKIFTLSK